MIIGIGPSDFVVADVSEHTHNGDIVTLGA